MLLAATKKKVELSRKKLEAAAVALEKQQQQLIEQAAAIAQDKKVEKLTPRQIAVKKELDAVAAKKVDIKKRRDELIGRAKLIKEKKKEPTLAERDIAKLKAGLLEEMKAVRTREAELSRRARDLDSKMLPATLAAQMKAEKERQARAYPRQALLKKKFGDVHPGDVADYVPKFPPVLQSGSEREYGLLTDASSYSEYAWAFLRRNRFYQRLIDRAKPNITVENWEYANDLEDQPPIGLINQKPYKEAFAVGVPVEWWGIHSFQEQLRPKIDGPQYQEMRATDWPMTQVSLTFDIGPMLGPTTAALDAQICIAKAYLQALAKSKNVSFPGKLKPPDKSLFRAQLRVADLLSAPQYSPVATDSYGQLKKNKKRNRTWLSISQVAELLPTYDLKRKGLNGAAATRTQKINRASELVKGAWDNIYNWKFLQALQFDNWEHLAAPKKKDEKSKKRTPIAVDGSPKNIKPAGGHSTA